MQSLTSRTDRAFCCLTLLVFELAIVLGLPATARSLSISPSVWITYAREGVSVASFNITGGTPPYTTTSGNVDRAFNDDGGTTGISGNGILDGDEAGSWTGSPIQVTVPATAAPGSVEVTVLDAVGQETSATIKISNAKGKISRNFYRHPYADTLQVNVGRDYVDHGNTPAGNIGPMDMTGQGSRTFVIVAAADGEVTAVEDSRSECGCDRVYGGCANFVRIRHENGEVATYTHIRQNSASKYGITQQAVINGLHVSAGDPIGEEGDVGFTCGSGRAATTGSCVTILPANAGTCGPHLHWQVRRESTNEFVNPMTCNIPNNIYEDNATYTASSCDPVTLPSELCPENRSLSDQTLDGFGTFRVVQSSGTITAEALAVQNRASLVLHAATRVKLLPGFRAGAGSAYFRAEIGQCNTTAPSP